MAYALYMFIAFCHTLAHDLVSGNQTLLNLTLFCQNCCDVWISIKFCQHFTFNFNVRLTNLLLSSGIWANRQAQQRDSSVPPGLRIIAQALGQHRTQQLSLRQRDGWTPLHCWTSRGKPGTQAWHAKNCLSSAGNGCAQRFDQQDVSLGWVEFEVNSHWENWTSGRGRGSSRKKSSLQVKGCFISDWNNYTALITWDSVPPLPTMPSN